jgi:hypothetical protein
LRRCTISALGRGFRGASLGVAGTGAGALNSNERPHFLQNLASRGLVVPQAQTRATTMLAPHALQKTASSSFLSPHFWQAARSAAVANAGTSWDRGLCTSDRGGSTGGGWLRSKPHVQGVRREKVPHFGH